MDDRKDIRVLVAVKKDILNKIVIDVRERNPVSRKYSRRTRVVNLYDNKIGNGCVWQGPSPTIRRAIQDISWR